MLRISRWSIRRFFCSNEKPVNISRNGKKWPFRTVWIWIKLTSSKLWDFGWETFSGSKWSLNFSCKVGCVSPLAVVSMLPHAALGQMAIDKTHHTLRGCYMTFSELPLRIAFGEPHCIESKYDWIYRFSDRFLRSFLKANWELNLFFMFQKKEKRMLQNLMFVKKNFVKRKVLKNLPITWRNSMFSAFRLGPANIGHGLCDIDRILFRVGESGVKK